MPPSAPPKKEDTEKEKKIRKIVNKGGGSTAKEDWTMISVRLPEILLRELDAATEKRFGLSRNAWILESLQEKLNK